MIVGKLLLGASILTSVIWPFSAKEYGFVKIELNQQAILSDEQFEIGGISIVNKSLRPVILNLETGKYSLRQKRFLGLGRFIGNLCSVEISSNRITLVRINQNKDDLSCACSKQDPVSSDGKPICQ